MRHDKQTMNAQRRFLAAVGFLLPILSVVFGFIAPEKNGPTFWYSISACFYATSGVLMIMTLGIFGTFLNTYKGYDLGDNVTTTISGTMAILVVIFPCKCDASGATTGLLNLPTGLSHVIHCIVAAILFGSFAYMVGFRFTKSDKLFKTNGKLKRDKVYEICAIIILAAMVCQIFTSVFGIPWMTIVNETIMLWAFSFAWAVKAEVFKFLNDKEENI